MVFENLDLKKKLRKIFKEARMDEDDTDSDDQ